MAGAIGIVFGLCVLSFTLGAALMYVVLRRREDAAGVSSPADEPVERTWVEKPAAVGPVDEDYDSRPIHRNPVMGLPQLEPALAVLADPVPDFVEPRLTVPGPASPDLASPDLTSPGLALPDLTSPGLALPDLAPPKTVGAARYDRDGDLDPPVGDLEAPESTVAPSTDSPEAVEPVAESLPVAEALRAAEAGRVAEVELVAGAERVAEALPVADTGRVVGGERVAEAGRVTKAERVAQVEPVDKAGQVVRAERIVEAERVAQAERVAEAGRVAEAELAAEAEAEADAESEQDAEPVAEPVAAAALPPPAAPQPVEHTTWVEREDFRQRYLRTFEEVRRKAGSN